MGAFNAVKEMGLSVPEDISIVGYDGIAYSQLLSPKLTTYLQDTDLIGVTAAKQLVSLIERGDNSRWKAAGRRLGKRHQLIQGINFPQKCCGANQIN